MIYFVLMILAGIGLSHILADSSIANKLKYRLIFREDAEGKPYKRFRNWPRIEKATDFEAKIQLAMQWVSSYLSDSKSESDLD